MTEQTITQETFTADVTQFLRPDGRIRMCRVELPISAKAGYDLMREKGCRLTAEELTTGAVSQTIEYAGDGDFDIKLTSNGPQVIEALVAMLEDFSVDHFDAWRAEMEADHVG